MKIKISSKAYLLLILLFSTLIVWPLFLQGYFFHHDDLQVMRIFEMKKCLQDLQIPCRWVPDMGYGNGFPLFNYYSALPYYIGGILSYFLGLINSAKALFFIPLVFGGFSMFIFSKKLFDKDIAFLCSILYAFAPYRALDSFVRGAVAESFAIAIIPLVFYFVLEIVEKPSRLNIVLGSISVAAFLLSHNIMTMFFMPFIIVWAVIILHFQQWKNWKYLLAGFVLGFGLSSFFLLPAFLEKNLVQTETLLRGGGDFRTHFVTVYQMFMDRSWGYGGSQFGPNDTISFQIGWPLWWFAIVAIPLFLINLRKNLKMTFFLFFYLGMFSISVFMMHNKSAFIWEAIPSLQYAQFPWRFLSLSIFSSSLLAGFCFYFLKFKLRNILIWASVITAVFLNWNFFIPREFYPWINDQNKLEDPLWEIQQKAGILDYLPKTAYEPHGRAPDNIELLRGNATGSNYTVRSNSFSVNVNAVDNSYIQIPVFDFPNWEVFSNGKLIPHDNKSNLGRISIELTPGEYKIEGKFKDTYVRIVANSITFFSWLLVLLIFFNKRLLRETN